MYTILVVVLVIISIALMGLIMLQQGKGADAGAAFGTGVSGTMFGSRGGGTFLSHVTAGLATAFFIVTLALAYMANHQDTRSHSVVDRVQAAQKEAQSGVLPPTGKASTSSSTPVMKTGAPEVATQGANHDANAQKTQTETAPTKETDGKAAAKGRLAKADAAATAAEKQTQPAADATDTPAATKTGD